MKDSLILKALHCRNFEQRPPVWLMRQAGRYMPEYRQIRTKHTFLDMCHHPELAAKVTLLPIDMFDMDAAILFSDILVIPEAFQVGLHFEEGAGPIIDRPLKTPRDVNQLPRIDVHESLDFVAQTIRLLKPQLKVPLIGFCGAPFTVASYMIEGKSSKTLQQTKKWMMTDPTSFHALLKRIADASIDYLNLQIEAGADALQIFDSWANFLSAAHFEEFSLHYLKYILDRLNNKTIPVILFCRGSSVFAPKLAEIHPAAISLDWNADIAHIRQILPPSIAIQGNLDPDILYAPHATIQHEVKRMLDQMQGQPGYIFNLGHGICPDMTTDAVRVLVDTVKTYG